MKTYFKILLGIYGVGLASALVCRIILKQSYMDLNTGLYTGGGALVPLFNAVLAAVPLAMFISNRLKKAEGDYPVYERGNAVNVLAVLTGAAAIAFALIGAPESQLHQEYSPVFYQIRDSVTLIFGVLAGLALILFGVAGILGKAKAVAGALLVLPAIWQMVLLITRFNSYTTVTAISDYLLAVLFMIFAALFFMGQARTLSGQMRKDGRNYAIPAGLCMSLCGFLLVIPNYIYVATHTSSGLIAMTGLIQAYAMSMPVALFGWFESFYVLLASIYAAVFTCSLMRSIKRV